MQKSTSPVDNVAKALSPKYTPTTFANLSVISDALSTLNIKNQRPDSQLIVTDLGLIYRVRFLRF